MGIVTCLLVGQRNREDDKRIQRLDYRKMNHILLATDVELTDTSKQSECEIFIWKCRKQNSEVRMMLLPFRSALIFF